MSFKIASKFVEAANVVNRVPTDKFPLLLNRIIQKLHIRVRLCSYSVMSTHRFYLILSYLLWTECSTVYSGGRRAAPKPLFLVGERFKVGARLLLLHIRTGQCVLNLSKATLQSIMKSKQNPPHFVGCVFKHRPGKFVWNIIRSWIRWTSWKGVGTTVGDGGSCLCQ